MCQCRRWLCIFWHTSFITSAMCVGKLSADHGFYRDIWGRIQENDRSCVLSATKLSPIARIFGRICKLIRHSNSLNAIAVIGRSLWNLISINTQNPPVLETCQQAARIKKKKGTQEWEKNGRHSSLSIPVRGRRQRLILIYAVKVVLMLRIFIGYNL